MPVNRTPWARFVTGVVICLLAGACYQGSTPAPSGVGATEPVVTSPASTGPTSDPAVALENRIRAGAKVTTALIGRLVQAAADSDRTATKLAVDELTAWGNDELAWLTDTEGAGCPGVALDSYRSGLRGVTLAALELSTLLIGDPSGATDEEYIQRLAERLTTGQETIGRAEGMALVRTCDQVTPVPIPGSAVLDGPTFNALAERLNRRYAEIREIGSTDDPFGYAASLLEVEQELLAHASAWEPTVAGVDDLVDAAGAMTAMLREARAKGSIEDARSSLRLAAFVIRDQRAAAVRIRAVLGLPRIPEGALL